MLLVARFTTQVNTLFCFSQVGINSRKLIQSLTLFDQFTFKMPTLSNKGKLAAVVWQSGKQLPSAVSHVTEPLIDITRTISLKCQNTWKAGWQRNCLRSSIGERESVSGSYVQVRWISPESTVPRTNENDSGNDTERERREPGTNRGRFPEWSSSWSSYLHLPVAPIFEFRPRWGILQLYIMWNSTVDPFADIELPDETNFRSATRETL